VVVSSSQPPIDEAIVRFIEGGVSILAASSDRKNLPAIVRAAGCQVSPDRRQVTLLVPGADPFLDVLRETGRVAVTFTQPSTHRTYQLKGEGARILPRRGTDAELTTRYTLAFAADVCPLGYSEELIESLVWSEPTELTPVAFEPIAVFLQTPGPRAGERLDSR
jgi:hypothetical protein